MFWRPRALLLVGAMVLAGCSQAADPAARNDDLFGTASIGGIVLDDEIRPARQVHVAAIFTGPDGFVLETLSDDQGEFMIDQLPPGKYVVSASGPGYRPANQSVSLASTQHRELQFVLETLAAFQLYAETREFNGKYDCAATTGPSDGSCDAFIEQASGQDVLAEDANHSLPMDPRWGGLLFEVDWSTGADADTIAGVRFKVGSYITNRSFIYVNASQPPLRVGFDAGRVHPSAETARPLGPDDEKVWVTVTPWGHGNGTCPEGIGCPQPGGSFELSYTVYATTFIGSGVDWGFTALPPPD